MFGPYYTARLGSITNFEARASFGGSTGKISPFGTSCRVCYTDEYSTDRLFMTAALSQNIVSLSDRWSFSPRFEYSYYSEGQEAYMDRNGTGALVPASDFTLTRLSMGPKVTRKYDYGDGASLSPSLSFTGTFDSSERISGGVATTNKTTTGKIDIGLEYQSSDGLSWNIGGYYDIITEGDVTSYGITAGIGIRF